MGRQTSLIAAAYLIASAALAVVIWIYAWSPIALPVWLRCVILLLLHALLACSLEKALAASPLRKDWRYRSAFLLSAGVYLGVFAWHLVSPYHAADWAGLGAAILGAFLGGLLSTSLNEHLWEDNSPPSELIQVEVYRRHAQVIGSPAPEPLAKRLFDIGLALLGLILSIPVWLLSTFLIWIENPGPLLFVKNSVGKGGANFHQLKLRTMVREAENHTGPVLSSEEDERVLVIGRFLRKTALDELPQLINILRGEMSFVGPRPQRTVLVYSYLESMPEYAERHRVLPGLAGLAQVAGDYYLTPRQKLRFDRLYIRHRSLGFDLKLILLAFAVAFWFRWQKGWDGRLPRKWFR
jgi:lipopolysaccharide/colanic/teichoic acid biosynthesis glycosyltransferase